MKRSLELRIPRRGLWVLTKVKHLQNKSEFFGNCKISVKLCSDQSQLFMSCGSVASVFTLDRYTYREAHCPPKRRSRHANRAHDTRRHHGSRACSRCRLCAHRTHERTRHAGRWVVAWTPCLMARTRRRFWDQAGVPIGNDC